MLEGLPNPMAVKPSTPKDISSLPLVLNNPYNISVINTTSSGATDMLALAVFVCIKLEASSTLGFLGLFFFFFFYFIFLSVFFYFINFFHSENIMYGVLFLYKDKSDPVLR